MQVMIDGRSVYLPPVSMVDWTNLPITINDIERIEVIRGPAAASHGANSLQGVISIITKDAGQMNGKSVSMRRGTHGINDVSAHFGEQGETFDYRMTVAYNADNGYNNLTVMPNNLPLVASTLNNSNDSNQARMVNFRTNYRPNGVDSFDVQMGFNHDTQVAGWNDSVGNPVHDVIANAGFMQLDWNRVLNASSEFRLRYYHIQHKQSEDFRLVSPPAPPIAAGLQVIQSNNTDRDEIEVQHTLQTGEGNRLVYGAGWRRDSTAASGYSLAMLLYKCPTGSVFVCPPSYSSSTTSNEYRIFAHDEWRISPQLLLNTGAMFEIDRMGHQRLSPRVAMNYHLAPAQTIRMGASVAYRTPAVIEEKYQTIPQPGLLFVPSQTVTSPGLVPEKVLSREIGYLGEFHDLEATLDVRLFVDEITKGILISPVTGMFSNIVSSLYRGVETTLKYSFDERKDLMVNFAHQSASSDVTPIGTLSRSIPRNSASLLYSQRLPHNWTFNASYYYQDMMQPYDRGPIDFQPSQRRADIRLGRKFALGKGTQGEAALIVQNLFDEQYTEYVVNNAFNRRSYLTLTLDW